MLYGKIVDGDKVEYAPKGLTSEQLENQGYLLVFESETAPQDLDFESWAAVYKQRGSVINQEWVKVPRRVKLDRGKLTAMVETLGFGEALTNWVQQSLPILTWWMGDLTYVRGSALAGEFMTQFGMSQDEMEAIVLQCKEV